MFWELAGIIVQVAHIALHMSGIVKYKGRLEDLAQDLCDMADVNRGYYETYRDCDPDFYEYYKTLPDSPACDQAISRSRGAAYADYAQSMRRSLKTVRGYSPLTKVHLNNMLCGNAIAQANQHRTVTMMRERANEDEHVLERWSAIVSAPVGVEKFYANATGAIISQSFKSLRAAGQGFNSAAAGLGTQLFKVLND